MKNTFFFWRRIYSLFVNCEITIVIVLSGMIILIVYPMYSLPESPWSLRWDEGPGESHGFVMDFFIRKKIENLIKIKIENVIN